MIPRRKVSLLNNATRNLLIRFGVELEPISNSESQIMHKNSSYQKLQNPHPSRKDYYQQPQPSGVQPQHTPNAIFPSLSTKQYFNHLSPIYRINTLKSFILTISFPSFPRALPTNQQKEKKEADNIPNDNYNAPQTTEVMAHAASIERLGLVNFWHCYFTFLVFGFWFLVYSLDLDGWSVGPLVD